MNDYEKAKSLAQQISRTNLEVLLELQAILDKNQNSESGDGSFNELTWTCLRDLLGSDLALQKKLLEFLDE